MRKATLSATERQRAKIRSERLHQGKRVKVVGLTLGAVRLRLFFSLLLLKLHVPIMHHRSRQLVDGDFLLVGEAQDVSGHLSTGGSAIKERQLKQEVTEEAAHVGGQQLLLVVNALHGDLTLADQGEVVRVGCDEKHLCREEGHNCSFSPQELPGQTFSSYL